MPDSMLFAALALVCAAALGELLWRRFGWPRPAAYAAVGLAVGMSGADVAGTAPALRLALDGALALLLFEAGARLNLRWLGRNPSLLWTSLCEALLSAVAVYGIARLLDIGAQAAAALGVIAMSVSPAVVQRVVGECHAAGQVTERLRLLSTLNTLYAILAMQCLIAGFLLFDAATWQQAWPPLLFSFCASLLLGVALGSVLVAVARRLDLRSDSAVVLLLCFILSALLIAKLLQLSTLLVPLLAGMWLRNRSERPWVWPHQFGSAGAALILVMFVATGASVSLDVWPAALGLAAAMLAIRALTKSAAILALAGPSGLAVRQAVALGGTMLPLSATAWVLALDFAATHPTAGAALLPAVLAAIALIDVIAPVVMFNVLRHMGELDGARPPGGGER